MANSVYRLNTWFRGINVQPSSDWRFFFARCRFHCFVYLCGYFGRIIYCLNHEHCALVKKRRTIWPIAQWQSNGFPVLVNFDHAMHVPLSGQIKHRRKPKLFYPSEAKIIRFNENMISACKKIIMNAKTVCAQWKDEMGKWHSTKNKKKWWIWSGAQTQR